MKFLFVLWLLLGSIMLTSLFCLFYVVSVTGFYTEDEPKIPCVGLVIKLICPKRSLRSPILLLIGRLEAGLHQSLTFSRVFRYHLQAFRHLYVLATEPRVLVPREVDTNKACHVPLEVTLKVNA